MAPPHKESTDLNKNFRSLQPRDIFSDVTLTCQGQEIKAHKLILYAQSAYFRKLLGGPFMEGHASTIDFPEDQPAVLKAIVHFLYTNGFSLSFAPTGMEPSVFGVHVYAAADKYNVPALRDLVLGKLSIRCDPVTNAKDFISALEVIGEATANDAIWDALLPKAKRHLTALLQEQDFQKLVADQPSFALKLLEAVDPNAKLDRDLETYRSQASDDKPPAKRVRRNNYRGRGRGGARPGGAPAASRSADAWNNLLPVGSTHGALGNLGFAWGDNGIQ
ncbi:hypothetical protein WHR41_07960 [Cladosporium halotolerans]|uniref:BTB domain-containing protein n=1 Tax=Cladosporium halotolerans TaxID=1052096 RepID=A0AB34KGW6_9PEZI